MKTFSGHLRNYEIFLFQSVVPKMASSMAALDVIERCGWTSVSCSMCVSLSDEGLLD